MTGTDLEDFVFLLNSERRRITIDLLFDLQVESKQDDVTVQLRDLGRQVAAIEADLDSVEVPTSKIHSAKTGLHQTHLPVLEQYGIVDYDDRAKEISTTDRTKPFAQLMRTIEDGIENSALDDIRPGGA